MLPFKVSATDELLTGHAGLALFGEFMQGIGFPKWLRQEMPPGSGRGYRAEDYVIPLTLMLVAGGRSLEDMRMLQRDKALMTLLKRSRLPSTDAIGDWLRRMGVGKGLSGLGRVNQCLLSSYLGASHQTAHTLDCDASQIVAEKASAQLTYKGERGYMPLIAHLAGMIILDTLRAGNTPPAAGNLEFIKACQSVMPHGHRIAHLRLDAAGYQADIFNYCEDVGISFAIGGRLDTPTLATIEAIPQANWKAYKDCWVAETLHSMHETHKAFRLVVVRYRHQPDLFSDIPRYHVIASNRVESAEDTLIWYRQRGDVSENGIKELKIGFGMERMPCGQLHANAVFFRIGVIAHNLCVLFKHYTLNRTWRRQQFATLRWRLLLLPGKVARHAERLILKVATELLDETFAKLSARANCGVVRYSEDRLSH